MALYVDPQHRRLRSRLPEALITRGPGTHTPGRCTKATGRPPLPIAGVFCVNRRIDPGACAGYRRRLPPPPDLPGTARGTNPQNKLTPRWRVYAGLIPLGAERATRSDRSQQRRLSFVSCSPSRRSRTARNLQHIRRAVHPAVDCEQASKRVKEVSVTVPRSRAFVHRPDQPCVSRLHSREPHIGTCVASHPRPRA